MTALYICVACEPLRLFWISGESMVNLGKARPAEGQVERQRQGQRQKQVFR